MLTTDTTNMPNVIGCFQNGIWFCPTNMCRCELKIINFNTPTCPVFVFVNGLPFIVC